MKLRWIVICLVILYLCAGCTQNTKQKAQQAEQVKPKTQQAEQVEPNAKPEQAKILQNESNTPNLIDGSEQKVRKPHPLSLADLRKKYRSTFLLNGPSSKREVALTFDDAPDDKFTPMVLDVLKREGVQATFFLVGNRIEAHPEIVKRMVREGHLLGNHSYNHANLPKLSDADFREQVIKTDKLISQYTGYTPNIIRPPYGNISEGQIQWLASQKKKVVNWNVDSLDWKGLTTEQVETNVLAHVKPGSIILQHSGGGKGEDLTCTVEALPRIIKQLRDDGVKLVNVAELLDLGIAIK
ncbi:polysaccharide deacetylase family protein [Paenibacillus lentus]|uniref:Polysaccharide deacetylase family protein n=1 Tax=Paenibacillus lentus TaxID=1338368 RepID=A0A3Q8S9S5_9BACL|nr:polysaccharide deacetylase family protein [Paenibacillus lentus]AZK45702.1 polysaccharide deacetylase family protein [Paenibacillus lentus]